MQAARSLFGPAPRSRATTPRALEITVREPAPPCKDAPLIAILEAPLASGETAFAGFARKERELAAAFAELTVPESRALHARLANPQSGDVLAAKFARLTFERRSRLLTFLADARRREALANARR